MWKWFENYKTHIISVAIGVATTAYSIGWIDAGTYQVILGFLGPAGLAALRAGVRNAELRNQKETAALRTQVAIATARESRADATLRKDVADAIVEADPGQVRPPGGLR